MLDPNKIDKYLYIKTTPAWKVKAIYVTGILSWVLVILGFSGVVIFDPIYRWFVGPMLFFITIYHFISFGVNLFYSKFNLQKHLLQMRRYWGNTNEPSIDIFLPICGEDIAILRHTWIHVSQLKYQNNRIYVVRRLKRELRQTQTNG